MSDSGHRGRDLRLVSTSFFALFGVVGLALYALPFYADFFVRDLGWTRGDFALGDFVAKLAVGPLLGFAAGWLIERVGPRRPMIVGVLCAGLALVGLGQVTGFAQFVLLCVLNALGYLLAGPLPSQLLLARHFQAGRGQAMGIAYLGIGAGFFAMPPLTALLSGCLGGWRPALTAIGVTVIAVALPLVLALREGDAASRPSIGPRPSLRGVLAGRSFYLLVIGSMLSVGAVRASYVHLKMLFTLDQNRTQAEATLLMSVLAAVSLVGRLAAGALADRLGPKRVMLMVYLLVVTATLLLVAGPTGNRAYLLVVILGLGLGGEYLIIPLMAAELFGTAVLGRVMGVVLTADGLAEAIFPWVAGRLHDRTHNYGLAFQVLAVTATAGAVAVALLPSARPLRR